MSWLIDAEVLIDDIENNGDKAIIDMIEAQPIAFDLEKVVKELEEHAEECREYWQSFDDEDAFGGMNAYCRAIEIVNRGGCNE